MARWSIDASAVNPRPKGSAARGQHAPYLHGVFWQVDLPNAKGSCAPASPAATTAAAKLSLICVYACGISSRRARYGGPTSTAVIKLGGRLY